MKITAVERLAKELESYGDPERLVITWEDLDSLIEKSKLMGKEQIISSWDDGYDKGLRNRIDKILDPVGNGDLYFERAFNSETND